MFELVLCHFEGKDISDVFSWCKLSKGLHCCLDCFCRKLFSLFKTDVLLYSKQLTFPPHHACEVWEDKSISLQLLPVFWILCSLLFQERNPLSVVFVVNVHGTTRPWSSTSALTMGLLPTGARYAWSSAAAWSPCRGTLRTMRCRTFPQAGALATPTCTILTPKPTLGLVLSSHFHSRAF